MRENYKAWDITLKDFQQFTGKDQLKFLIRFATLAPSSHNTQPWAFKVVDDGIKVYKEQSRRLPVADVNDRQLFLSIGCAIENIIVAADYYGFLSIVKYVDDQNDHDLCAIINLIGKIGHWKGDDHLIHSIVRRKTNRNKYKQDLIPHNVLDQILNYKSENIDIFIVHDKSKIEKLADIAVLSSIESMVDDKFRYELSHHLKHNLTKSKIGMPGFTLGIPTPVSFAMPHLMKRFNMEKAAQKQNKILFNKHTPYITIIATRGDSKMDWLEAGQIYERLSLYSTIEGISLSPWGAPIEIGQFYKSIQEVLDTNLRPQMFFRMGYAKKSAKNSPRFNHEELLK